MSDKPLRYYWRIYKIGELPDHEKHGTSPHAWRTKDLKTAAKNILSMAKLCCSETKYFDYHNKIEPPKRFWSGWRFDFGTPDFYGYARRAR